MGTTTNYALRYPALTDAPDGPTQVQDLAEDVDAALDAAVTDQWVRGVYVEKTADEGRSNTVTLADDGPTGGSLALAGLVAGAKYEITGLILYDGGAATSAGLFDWTFTVPSGSTMTYSYARENSSGTYSGAYPSNGSTVNTANTTGVGTTMSVTIHGRINVAANGTLQFRWAQHVAKSTNTHVLAGSFLAARRVA